MLKSKTASNKYARENSEESVDRHDLRDMLWEVWEKAYAKLGIITDVAVHIESKKEKRYLGYANEAALVVWNAKNICYFI